MTLTADAKLGAYTREYHRDFYGAMPDKLNAGLPSDRIYVEWPIGHDRTYKRLRGEDAPPAVLALLPWDRRQLLTVGRRYALAGVIGLLLASPLLVPLWHFLPEFAKDGDPRSDWPNLSRMCPLTWS